MLNRREFLVAATAAPVGAVALGDLFIEPDDRTRLVALATLLLPSELGARGIAQTVERFERWVSGYRAGAEVNHGYGTGRLEVLPADPWPRWRAQLVAMEPITLDKVQTELASAERLPSVLTAPHIALALLSWFYASPEANDLCYQARILRDTCRPLATVQAKP